MKKVLTAYDSNLVLADTQAISTATTTYGKDSGGTAIVKDLGNYKNAKIFANLRYTDIDFGSTDETYTVEIQSCDSSNFSSTPVFKTTIPLGIAASVVAGNVLRSFAFCPEGRYVRAAFITANTTPGWTIDKLWLSPES